MRGIKPCHVLAFAFGALAAQVADMAAARAQTPRAQTPVAAGYVEPLDAATPEIIRPTNSQAMLGASAMIT